MPLRAPAARTLVALLVQLASLSAASLLASPARVAAAAEEKPPPVIYRWVDETGVPHYTAQRDRIPSAVRGSVREVRASDAAPPSLPPNATSTSTSSPTAPAAPGEAWIARDAGAAGAAASATPAPASAAPDAFRESERPGDDAKLAAPSAVATRSAPSSGVASGELDQRITALEAEIARDEEALKNLLSEPPAHGGVSLADRPEFREIARRLPQRQAALRDLRDQRSRLGRP